MLNTQVASGSLPHGPSFDLTTAAGTLIACVAIASFIALAPAAWLTVALAAAAGAVLVLIFPWLAWLGLAFTLPIASGMRIGPASATDLFFAASLALWCASFIMRRRTSHTPNIPIWPVALYLLVLYVSSLGASDLAEALKEMVKWVEFGILLLVVPLTLPPRVVPWLVAALFAAATLQAFYGLYQFVFRVGPDWFLIQGRFMRASGVFAQPNPFGGYLGLSLPVAMSLTLWSITSYLSSRSVAGILRTCFYALAASAIFVGLIASWSRGAWLGAAGGMIVVLAFYNHRTALMLALCMLAFLTSALLGALNPSWIPATISSRIGDIPAYLGFVNVLTLEVNDDNFAVIERVAHWVAALRMWDLSPWLGIGPGNYATVYESVALPRWRDPLGHAHNIYLNVLGETGLLGLGAFLLMWSFLVGWLSQQTHSILPAQSWSRALAVGVLGVVAHLAIHSLFDNLFVQGIYLHLAFWFAAVAASEHVPGALNSSSSTEVFVESDG